MNGLNDWDDFDNVDTDNDALTTRFSCVFDPKTNKYAICLLTIDTMAEEVVSISPPVVSETFISHAECLAYIECVFKDVRSQFLLNNTFVLED